MGREATNCDPTANASDLMPKAASVLNCLSPRELEIVHHLYEGAKNHSIALRLKISKKTVEKHRAHLMSKLKVGSFAELIRIVTLARSSDPENS